jgi:hypothetical protein
MTPEIFYGIGALILGLGLAYGGFRYAMRDKSKDPIAEAATREMKDHPERYDETREIYERAAKKD